MGTFLDLCERLFANRNLYQIFHLHQDASEAEVQKAYRQMSKLFHPDRATDDQLATEKFQVLNKAYEILIDPIKRQIYDADGRIDCDEKSNVFVVSDQQLAKCQENYAGSDRERTAVRNAFMNGRGRMNFIMKNVPFIQLEDLPRVTAIVNELKRSGCVPELPKIPVNEAKKKTDPIKKRRRAPENELIEQPEIKKAKRRR